MSVKFVKGEGNLSADIVFIGEAPGEQEDIQGRPFVGRSGKLLNKYIEYLGHKREDCYITNIVKVRPNNNRTPTDEEIKSWLDLLESEIIYVCPKIIVTLGLSSTKALLGGDIRMRDVKGKIHNIKGINILPTYHPAYCLRNPKAKELVKQDLNVVKEFLNE